MNTVLYIVLIVLAVIVGIQFLILFTEGCRSGYKYFGLRELDLLQRYGTNSWVVITGGSSGQGRQFALNFARRSFNILLIGSTRNQAVMADIQQQWPSVQTKLIVKDFGRAFEERFFDDIDNELRNMWSQGQQISVLVNNVGHRTGWIPYHEQDPENIRATISCGTLVQARLTQMVLPYFLARSSWSRSAIVFITAQCMHPNMALGVGLSNEIYLPFLSVYEAANAFGFYHANSLIQEYGDKLDMLNITPGAVVTENTPYLKDVWFNIDCRHFVTNIMRMLGQVQGTTCAHWGHALSVYLINLAPWSKDRVLFQTGETIANYYMSTGRHKTYA